MKPTFIGLKKQTNNRFLNMYEMDAVDTKGKHFPYYFATRKDDDQLVCRTKITKPDGAVIYAIKKDEVTKCSRIVLIKQYRYPLDMSLYELPAGLIEEGESIEDAAKRELKEETGLDFKEYKGGLNAFRKAFYQAQGLCDESNSLVFGYASGNISYGENEDQEAIEVILADRDEAIRILKEEQVSIRCAYMLMQFIHSNQNDDFNFLNI